MSLVDHNVSQDICAFRLFFAGGEKENLQGVQLVQNFELTSHLKLEHPCKFRLQTL